MPPPSAVQAGRHRLHRERYRPHQRRLRARLRRSAGAL